MIAYLDTSALIKLIHAEPESTALRDWLAAHDVHVVTSIIGEIELHRVARRYAGEGGAAESERICAGMSAIPLTPVVTETSKTLPPQVMRSLDAIHVATALTLGSLLDALVTYDDRMAQAVRAAGLEPISPGR